MHNYFLLKISPYFTLVPTLHEDVYLFTLLQKFECYEKNRAIQIQKDVYLCFIIYAKALLRNLVMSENDIRINRNLYWHVILLAEMYADDTVF